MIQVALGIYLLVLPGRGFWFRAGLGVFCLGSAVRWIALSTQLTTFRGRLGLSTHRGFRLMCSLYMLAGALVAVGALTSLDLVFAIIVTWSMVGWISVWAWVLVRSWNEPIG